MPLPASPSPTGLISEFEEGPERTTEVLEEPPKVKPDDKADAELLQALVARAPIAGGPSQAEEQTPVSSELAEAAVLEGIRTFGEESSSSDWSEPSDLPDPLDSLIPTGDSDTDTYLASEPNESWSYTMPGKRYTLSKDD